ncbi:hypothetical protein MCOR25_006378 [Pyricularia grisea]|uniref:Uncharacterized protein n=1 Tax=Pyricularia grisea TaxID=148305 RepID=A0A6P8AQF1_PYRGI|nr:uncharacterized protein PgNI_12053 [Pyricularia grisea]KAI6361812.1 hypothetical protein MCOR25_006378 [Pyricularia grisea]TLD04264.1 hypothetical protein PgNI_12053 [Pyricularia grisea]
MKSSGIVALIFAGLCSAAPGAPVQDGELLERAPIPNPLPAARVCTPPAWNCSGSNMYVCNSGGDWSLSARCGPGRCVLQNGGAYCVA